MSRRPSVDTAFTEIAELIAAAKGRAFQAVNIALIDLHWQVGGIISRKIEAAEWGEGVVPQLAEYLARTHPGLRGFTRPNLFRMRQFYEAWREHAFVPTAPAQSPPSARPGGKAAIVSAVPRQLTSSAREGGRG